jgi:hypothetical protein
MRRCHPTAAVSTSHPPGINVMQLPLTLSARRFVEQVKLSSLQFDGKPLPRGLPVARNTLPPAIGKQLSEPEKQAFGLKALSVAKYITDTLLKEMKAGKLGDLDKSAPVLLGFISRIHPVSPSESTRAFRLASLTGYCV